MLRALTKFPTTPAPPSHGAKSLLPDNDSNNDLCDLWIIHNLFWTLLTKHRVFMITYEYIEVSHREEQRESGVPILR